jgi:aquaporin Z
MLDLITEFIGTFIFLSVVISSGQAIPIGLTLAAVILFGAGSSATHFNPAISTMMMVAGKMPLETYAGYVIAQILGGLCALLFFNYTPVGKKLIGKK